MMETYHVLNGDCLAAQLSQTKINQNFIICRECLIDGNVTATNLTDFWTIRAQFIAENYHTTTEAYFQKTVEEFDKLQTLPEHAEVCLWFEHDLFCQINLWFVLSLLAEHPTLKLYRILPIVNHINDIWRGFGVADSEMLEKAYANKVLFTPHDIELGNNLWNAYQQNDFEKLKELAKTPSACFQYLEDVCQAQIDRFKKDQLLGRPERAVKEIMEITTDFTAVFNLFSAQQAIYGFGDSQVKRIYDRLIKNQN